MNISTAKAVAGIRESVVGRAGLEAAMKSCKDGIIKARRDGNDHRAAELSEAREVFRRRLIGRGRCEICSMAINANATRCRLHQRTRPSTAGTAHGQVVAVAVSRGCKSSDAAQCDLHFSINYPSNTSSFFKVTNGPTLTLSFTNHGRLEIQAADTPHTYVIYFKTEASPSYVTNWNLSVWAGSVFSDPGELLVTADAWTADYGSGTHAISSTINVEYMYLFSFPTHIPIDSASITPAPVLYWTLTFSPFCYDGNGLIALDAVKLALTPRHETDPTGRIPQALGFRCPNVSSSGTPGLSRNHNRWRKPA